MSRQERVELKALEDWHKTVAEAVVPVVEQNHAGCSFKTTADVPIRATATARLFTRRMADAKLIAARTGFNAVTPANPTGDKYGNGWVPALI